MSLLEITTGKPVSIFENQPGIPTKMGMLPFKANSGFEQLITKRQLAEKVGLSQSFINKLMNEDGLPHFKIGRAVRFRVTEVVTWLQKRRRS